MPGQGGVANSSRSLPGSLRRAREILRQGGFRLLLVKVLGETVYRREVMLAVELGEPAGEPALRLALHFEYLAKAGIDEFLEFHPFARRDETAARIDRGESCLVARHRGRIVSSLWAAPRGARVAGLEMWPRLARGEVYVYDAFTAAEYRGWGTYPAVAFELARRLAESGHTRMIGLVRVDADRARRAHEQSGYSPFGSMGWIKLGPFRRDFQLCLHVPCDIDAAEGRRSGWHVLPLRAIDLRALPPIGDTERSLELDYLKEDGIDDYVAVRPAASRDETASRLARGERCAVARHGDRPVSVAWIAEEGTWDALHRCWIRTAFGEAYVYDRYTAPEWSGTDVGSALARRLLDELARSGCERVVFPTDGSPRNDPGVTGGRPLGRTGTIRLGGWAREFVLTKRTAAPSR